MLLGWIILFSLLGSVGALAGAALLLVFPQGVRALLLPCLISYATGTLLGAAFLGLLPRALAAAPSVSVMAAVLAGLGLFFLLEKMVLWRHCHNQECPVHAVAGPLILFGDAFHNFTDGAIIAASFMISIPLGVTTAVAVAAHEIPQEVGDFAILLDSGYSRPQALTYNLLSALATLPGALLTYWYMSDIRFVLPYIVAAGAASFIYIALADLTPTLHRHLGLAVSVRQFALILLGVGTILILRLHH